MKKIIQSVLVLTGSSLAVVACSSGATDARSGAPGTANAPVATPVASAAATVAPASGAHAGLPAGYVRVPGSIIAHQDCVHEIPDGSVVQANGDVTMKGAIIAHHEACKFPSKMLRNVDGSAHESTSEVPGVDAPTGSQSHAPGTGGWVVSSWAYSTTATGFNHMNSGNFVVPAAPSTNNSQIIYMFPSFQSSDSIVQPVLQWGSYNGSAGAIGGAKWVYAAWALGNDGNFYHSTGIDVNPGDTLNGWMDLGDRLSASLAFWGIGGTDVTTGQSMGGGFWTNGKVFNSAQGGVLEAYGVTKCTDFPATGYTIFGTPTLTQGTATSWKKQTFISPSWTTCTKCGANAYSGVDCGFSVSASAANGTSLVY